MTTVEPRQRSPLAEMGLDRYGASPKLLTKRRTSPRIEFDLGRSGGSRNSLRIADEDQEEAKDVLPDGPGPRALLRKSPQRQESHSLTPKKKWTSAFRVVQSITRFKNAPIRGRKDSNASNVGSHKINPKLNNVLKICKESVAKVG